jgi:hypothetical protein
VSAAASWSATILVLEEDAAVQELAIRRCVIPVTAS